MGKKTLKYKQLVVALAAICLLLAAFSHGGVTQTLAKEAFAFTQQTTVMRVGQRMNFSVNRDKVAWNSSNPKVASVSSNGLVKARRKGEARITASSGGEKISVMVAVKQSYVVGIDPGHQLRVNLGEEPIGPGSSTTKTKMSSGTRGVSTKKPEYELNMEVSLKLAEELKNRGYKVVLSHSVVDVDLSNIQRAEKLNNRCDAVIRIHADGAAAAAHGASALYPSASNPYVGHISAACERLSRNVLDNYCASTGIRNRGLSLRDDLTGTNWSQVPVTLIEMGFMTNAFDDEFMSSADGQEKMVKGMANGIDAYFMGK